VGRTPRYLILVLPMRGRTKAHVAVRLGATSSATLLAPAAALARPRRLPTPDAVACFVCVPLNCRSDNAQTLESTRAVVETGVYPSVATAWVDSAWTNQRRSRKRKSQSQWWCDSWWLVAGGESAHRDPTTQRVWRQAAAHSS
jgi:hypothetical protein